MNGPDRRALRLFVHGTWDDEDPRYEQLYGGAYRNYPESEEKHVSLIRLEPHNPRKCPAMAKTGMCTCRVKWAVIKPLTERSGTVEWSNTLKPGAAVRARTTWFFMKQRVAPGSMDTIGSPSMLAAPTVPRAVKPQSRLRARAA